MTGAAQRNWIGRHAVFNLSGNDMCIGRGGFSNFAQLALRLKQLLQDQRAALPQSNETTTILQC